MKDDKLYLIHLSESIAKIELYIKDLDYTAFIQNTLVQDAVLRNILVHDYLGIELETVWGVVTDKLPELKSVVQSALMDS